MESHQRIKGGVRLKLMTKLDEVRKFFKRLPKGKWISMIQLERKFKVHHSHCYVIMRYLEDELKLKTELREVFKDNGSRYNARVYYK